MIPNSKIDLLLSTTCKDMPTDTYTDNAVISVHAFTQQREGDEVIIGRIETGVFLAVPPEAIEILEHLARGESIGRVSEWHEAKYGEKPDMEDFLRLLEAKGLIGWPGNTTLVTDRESSSTASKVRYHFSNFPQDVARHIFGKWSIAAAFLLILLAAGATIYDSSLLPNSHDLFFTSRRALTWTILIALDLVAVFIHELAHLVAARAVGVRSRLGIGNRLWDLVAETDLTGLWGVPKRERYLPMLAGMLVDAASGAALLLLLFAAHQQLVALPIFYMRLLRAIVFAYCVRIVWQFLFFVRTDLYYVLATYFNCKNLMADTEALLRNDLGRIFNSIPKIDQSSIPVSESKVIRAYSGLWVAGRLWAVVALFWVSVPVSLSYIRDLLKVFSTGYSANPGNFIDAALLTAYVVVPLVLGLFLWTRSLITRRWN